MTDQTEDDRGGVQAIARAAAVLRALSRDQGTMSLGAIASATGLPRSTVQRLVQALRQERFVDVGDASCPGVRLGPALAELASSIRVDVVRLVRPHLEALFEAVRETVDFSQAQGKQVQFLDQIVSDQELRVVPRREAALSLHCMANGKALLATMPDSVIEQFLGPKLERTTRNSIATLPELLAELAMVRSTGYAYDRQEHSYGVCAVGIGVGPVYGRHYAVSAAVPAQRFETVLPAIRTALLSCKEGIETALLAAGQSSA